MAVKTFTDNTSLPASDINTYLNNGGLVYIAGTSISSSSAYVEIANCFSATYDNYRIVINNVQSSQNVGLAFYLGTNASTSLYYGSLYYDQYSGALTNTARVNGGNFAFIGFTDTAADNGGSSFDLNAPFLAKQKTFHGTYDGRNFAGWFGGLVADTTSFTGIRFINSLGNLTSGTFRVYGYRQA